MLNERKERHFTKGCLLITMTFFMNFPKAGVNFQDPDILDIFGTHLSQVRELL